MSTEETAMDGAGDDREPQGSPDDDAWPVDDDGWERDAAPGPDVESVPFWPAIRTGLALPYELDAGLWFG
jgi:hypothetical protein